LKHLLDRVTSLNYCPRQFRGTARKLSVPGLIKYITPNESVYAIQVLNLVQENLSEQRGIKSNGPPVLEILL